MPQPGRQLYLDCFLFSNFENNKVHLFLQEDLKYSSGTDALMMSRVCN